MQPGAATTSSSSRLAGPGLRVRLGSAAEGWEESGPWASVRDAGRCRGGAAPGIPWGRGNAGVEQGSGQMLNQSCCVFLSDVRGLEVKPEVCKSTEVFPT